LKKVSRGVFSVFKSSVIASIAKQSILALTTVALISALFLFSSASIASAAGEGWLTGWQARKAITISHANVDADLTDFPLLVKFANDTAIGAKARSDGYDLRFTSSDGTTLLKYERETFSVSSGSASGNIWVKVPTVSGSIDTTVYMYYGKSDATDGQDAGNVWNDNFQAVWHMNGAASEGGTMSDSKGLRDLTAHGSWNAGSLDSPINAVTKFNGTDTYMEGLAYNPAGAFTFSGWAKVSGNGVNYSRIIVNGPVNTSWSIQKMDGDQHFWTWRLMPNFTDVNSAVLDDGWHYVTGTYNGSDTSSFYIDGISVGTVSYSGTVPSTEGTISVGGETAEHEGAGNASWLDGGLDELRISSIDRSAEWIKFEYNNMNSAGNELTFASEENNYGWLTGWGYRKKITISHANVDSDLTNFPLLVKVAETGGGDGNIGAHALANGNDIRFTSSDGVSLLPYERETYSVSSNNLSANMWVKVPNISGTSNTEIYIYYGKTGASDGQNAAGVWESNYNGVFHLASNLGSSSVGGVSGTNNGATQTTGKVNGGASFDNANINLGDVLSASDDMTFSFWYKRATSSSGDDFVVSKGIVGSDYGYGIYYDVTNTCWRIYGAENNHACFANSSEEDDTNWHFIEIIKSGTEWNLYRDTVSVSTIYLSGGSPMAETMIGGVQGNPGFGWEGSLDEVRFSNVTMYPDWLKFEYNNINSANNELTFGSQTTTPFVWTNSSGDGLWSTCSNWLTGTCPGASDVAIFNAASGDVSIDQNVSVAGVEMQAGYSGTITQATGVEITVGTSGGWSQAAGVFTGSNGNITLNGGFSFSAGTYTASSGTTLVRTGWTHSSGTFNHNNGTVSLTAFNAVGSFNIDVPSSGTFKHLTINGGTPGSNTDFVVSSEDTLIVLGNFVQSVGAYTSITGGTIKPRANISIGPYATAGSTAITLDSTGDQTIEGGGTLAPLVVNKPSGTVTVSGSSVALSNVTLTSGNFVSTSGTLSIFGNYTNNGGTFTHNGGTVVFTNGVALAERTINVNSSETFYNVQIRGEAIGGSAFTISSGDKLIVDNNLNLESGGYTAIYGGTIEVKKNVVIGNYMQGGTTALSFTGTGTQTYTYNGGGILGGTWTINKPSGEVVLNSDLTLNTSGQDLTLTSGTLDLNGKTLTVNDTFSIGAAGILNTDNGTHTEGTFTNNGTIIDQRTWIGGTDTNWNTAANWSGGQVPGSGQTVKFDNRCASNCNATINANANVAGITLASTYTGTLTQGTGNTITVGSSGWSQAGGTFSGGDSAITINGSYTLSGGTFTSTSGTLTMGTDTPSGDYTAATISGSATFGHNNGTIEFKTDNPPGCVAANITLNIPSSVTLNNVVFDIKNFGGGRVCDTPYLTVISGQSLRVDGDLNLANVKLIGEVILNGNLSVNSGSYGGPGTITLSGAASQTYSYETGGTAPNIKVNKSTGSVVPAPGTTDFRMGTLTLEQGSFTAPTGTITVGYFTPTTDTKLLDFASGTTFTANSGTLNLQTASVPNCVAINLTVDVATTQTVNNLIVNTPKGGCDTPIITLGVNDTLLAEGDITLTQGILSGSWQSKGDVAIGSSFFGGDAAITLTGVDGQSFTNNGGTIPSGTFTINKSSGEVILNTDLTLNSSGQDLTITSGALDTAGYAITVNDALTINGTLKLKGNETITAGTKTLGSSSTVEFRGDGDSTSDSYTITDFATSFGNLAINSTDGTTDTYTLGNNINVAGNFSNNGTFSPSTNTITLNGTSSGKTFNPGTSSLYALTLNGVGGVWDLNNNLTLTSALTLQNGTLDLNGYNLDLTGATFSNAGTIRLQNTETLTNVTPDTNSGTVEYDGAGTFTSFKLGNEYNNLTFNNASAVWNLPADLIVNGNLTLTAGNLNQNSHDLSVTGNISRTSGTLSNTATRTLTLNGIAQDINFGDITWGTLTLTGSSGSATIGSNFSVNTLLSIPAGRNLSLGSYIINLVGSLLNAGSISKTSGYISKAPSNLEITDHNFDNAPGISVPAAKVYVSLSDEDANADGTTPDTVNVTITCPNDSELVTLTETGNATEVFRNSGLTTAAYTGSATNNNSTLSCSDGDTITVSYADPSGTVTDTSLATSDILTQAPSSFAGSASSSNSITWTWTDNANNENGFKIYSGTGTLIATIATPNTTSYTETGLTKGTSYTRKVASYNNAGNTYSSTATVTTPAEPTPPSSFNGTAISSTAITWTWTDNANDETGFKLLNNSGDIIATIATSNTTSYTETGLTKGTSYTRKVVAYNSDGTSAASSTKTVTTKETAPSSPTLSSPVDGAILRTATPTFSFQFSADEDDGISSYTVLIDDGAKAFTFDAPSSYTNFSISGASISSTGDTISVTLTNDLTEGNHTWKVRATDAGGNTGTSDEKNFSLDISKPRIANVTISGSLPVSGTDLATSASLPVISFDASDSTALKSSRIIIKKISYFLGEEISRKTVFDKELSITGKSRSLSFTPTNTLDAGRYVVSISVSDNAGNTVISDKTLVVVELEEKETIVKAEPPKTIEEIKKMVEEGETPSKTSQIFQLPELEKQALIRQEKASINLNEYLDKIVPHGLIKNTEQRLVNAQVRTSTWFRNLGFGISNKIVAFGRSLERSQNFVAARSVRFAVSVAGKASALRVSFVQISHQSRMNRIDLAIQTQKRLAFVSKPLVMARERAVKVAKFAADTFSGRHDEELKITDVVVTALSSNSAEVSWKTSRSTTGKLNFGPTTMYGSSIFVDEARLEHKVFLENLSPETKYYFEVLATDQNGKQVFDAYYSFTTPNE